jgi:hypothetical protein
MSTEPDGFANEGFATAMAEAGYTPEQIAETMVYAEALDAIDSGDPARIRAVMNKSSQHEQHIREEVRWSNEERQYAEAAGEPRESFEAEEDPRIAHLIRETFGRSR